MLPPPSSMAAGLQSTWINLFARSYKPTRGDGDCFVAAT